MDPSLVYIPPKPSQEEEILELAKKELLRDIKCASIRAEQFGAHSWAKPQKYVPSKRFLKHMIVNDSRFNDRKEQKSLERREITRSKHSSSYIRHIKDQSEKSSKSYLSHSRHSKKRDISSEDERIRSKRDNLYPEKVKHLPETKVFKKSYMFDTFKEREIVSPNDAVRGIKKQRERSSSSQEKHTRKKHRKYSLVVLDKKIIVSSDKEKEKNKNLQSMSYEKEKHSKSKKHRKKFPFKIDVMTPALHSKHVENAKEMSSEEDKISSLSRHGKKHSEEKLKKITSKWHK